MTRVLIAGTYDPITLGHMDLIELAAREYGHVTVAIFVNPDKEGHHLLSPERRRELICLACAHLQNVDAVLGEGYTADYARENGYDLLLRGWRDEGDLAWEEEMARYNLARGGIPTRLVKADPRHAALSSTEVRRLICAGELDALSSRVPAACIPRLRQWLAEEK